MSASPKIFARILKIDEERRLVYGRATEEVIDRADEVMDYESSKPLFMKWSAECHKDSGGKSLGNVRAMHGPIAAGKLTDITFDDEGKAIDVVSKCVDDDEWKKILEGVYTGYSIGGDYKKKWSAKMDGKKVTRFTADPSEISYVDRPCVPTAKFFDVVKHDGTVMRKLFKEFAEPSDSTSGIAGYGSGDEKPKKKPKEKTMKMRKDCYAVQTFASLISSLKYLSDSQRWEADYEGDDSQLPKKLTDKAAELLELLAEMAIEEAGELRAPAVKVDMPSMAKFLGIDLEKAGRRNSSSDLSLIQSAHDAIAKLGAACRTAEPEDGSPITLLETPNMGENANKADNEAKLGKGGVDMGGTSGGPGGKEVESTNAKADGTDPDAETSEEKDERLKRRATKKFADAQKAAGLPATKEELDALLAKNAEGVEDRFANAMAKALGIVEPKADAAAPAGDTTEMQKAAPAAAAKRPALYAVGKEGGATKLSTADELAKSVDPVPGDNGHDPMRKAATLIKGIHAQGPGWYENQGTMSKRG